MHEDGRIRTGHATNRALAGSGRGVLWEQQQQLGVAAQKAVVVWEHESDIGKSRKITIKVSSADTCFIAVLFHVITPRKQVKHIRVRHVNFSSPILGQNHTSFENHTFPGW